MSHYEKALEYFGNATEGYEIDARLAVIQALLEIADRLQGIEKHLHDLVTQDAEEKVNACTLR